MGLEEPAGGFEIPTYSANWWHNAIQIVTAPRVSSLISTYWQPAPPSRPSGLAEPSQNSAGGGWTHGGANSADCPLRAAETAETMSCSPGSRGEREEGCTPPRPWAQSQ